ncbi:MAG: hypothetical protein J5825_05195 [Lachnospiraceae bacterium]|nr:hypothetical protein [Lachnospiraceae bacterium]
MKVFRMILLHISSVLAITFITFYILDYYNPFMNYLANPMSKTLIMVLGIVTIISNEITFFMLIRDWGKKRKKDRTGTEPKQEGKKPASGSGIGEIEEI